MKFKRMSICSILALGFILSGVKSFAAEPITINSSTEEGKITSSTSQVATPEPLEGHIATTKAAPDYNSYIEVNWFPITGSNAFGTSKSSVSADFIKVTTRLYKNGSIESSGSDSAKYATYAGKRVYGPSTKQKYKAYGNHEYKKSGYKDYYVETKTDEI